MSLLRDLKPFLEFSKVFGFSPYSVSAVGVSLSRLNIVYSGFCTTIYIGLVCVRFDGLKVDGDKKLRILTILRTLLLMCVILIDILVCVIWHRKLQASIHSMQRYDHAVKLEATPRINSIRCLIGLIAMTVYFFGVSWLTYIYEAENALEDCIIYFVFYTALSSSILKFSAISVSLLRRFRHLNRIIKTGSWKDQRLMGWPERQLNLRDTWCLHNCLVAAGKELNSLYSAQLLLWIAGLTFNIISRIYVFSNAGAMLNTLKLLREGGMALASVLMLTVLTGVCHMTAAEANKVGGVTFSPNSSIFRRRRGFSNTGSEEQTVQIGLYFLFHRFYFSAASGLVQVDLPLLQTIAGATTTYLVILKSPG